MPNLSMVRVNIMDYFIQILTTEVIRKGGRSHYESGLTKWGEAEIEEVV